MKGSLTETRLNLTMPRRMSDAIKVAANRDCAKVNDWIRHTLLAPLKRAGVKLEQPDAA